MTVRGGAADEPASADPARPRGASATAVPGTPGSGASGPSRWDVETLCGPSGEAILVHKGEHYRLRVTARGRLILTK